MEQDNIEMSWIVAATPDEVYEHWLSSEGHAAMTGGAAQVDPRVGGAFTAWDGYIRGVTEELEPGKRIVQSWRTAEFADGVPDSRIELRLRSLDGKTQVILRHTALAVGDGAKYTLGWFEHYLRPMTDHFGDKD
jgi:activator of HSP90 ATPase